MVLPRLRVGHMMIKLTYHRALHGTAERVKVDGFTADNGHFGYVGRQANGYWKWTWNPDDGWNGGYKTRTDATVALMLGWCGTAHTPTAAQIYRWVVAKTTRPKRYPGWRDYG